MWIWRERSLCYLGCQCWSCFSHPFTFWILCLLRWSRGRFCFHRRKRTWQVITLSHNRLTFLPNDFPRTAGLEPSDRVFGMDFLVGKKIHHHFQMTSWHLWGTTTWNKRKGFLVGERFSKKHTHFPQQIGGAHGMLGFPVLKEASNIGAHFSRMKFRWSNIFMIFHALHDFELWYLWWG